MYFLGTFETGNTGQFTSGTGSVQSSVVKEDTYAGLNENGENFIKDITTDYGDAALPHSFSGAWFRWTDTPQNAWQIMLGVGETSPQFNLVGSVTNGLKILVVSTYYQGTTVLTKDTWYFILVDFYCHNTEGYCKVYVDGVLDIDTGTIDTRNGTDTGVKKVTWLGTSSASANCYVDNCLFCDYDPNFGIKVSKAGKSALSMASNNLDWNSNFRFLKFHDEYNATVTISEDGTEATASITHGLGYVPSFVAYFEYEGNIYIVPSVPWGVSYDQYAFAHATSNTIVVGYHLNTPYNRQIITASDYYNSYWGAENYIEIGREGSTGVNGAIRFTGVNIAAGDTITRAKVQVYTNSKMGDTSKHVRWHNFGIDEDNTSSFGDPFGRSRTTATNDNDRTVPTNLGDIVEIEAVSMINEIKGRGGWSSGNAMGFVMIEDGSDNDAWFNDALPPSSYLEITKQGTLSIPFKIIVFKDKIAS